MKTIFTLSFLILTGLSTYSQDIILNPESGKYHYQELIQMDVFTKDFLFIKSKEWIALNYKSANDVIQFENINSGKIIIKGNFKTSIFFKDGWIRHTLIIDIKDGKIRFTYTDFSYYSHGSGGIDFEDNMAFKKKVFEETSLNIRATIIGITTYIKANESNDDW